MLLGGNELLAQNAGAAHWDRVVVSPGAFFDEVFFADENNGWISESGTNRIHRTRDGGTNWEVLTTPEAVGGSPIHSFCFLTNDVGFVGGYGIWKTNDGGDNWIDIDPGLGDSVGYEIWFVDADNGVFGTGSCESDTIWFGRTTDGGTNWTVQSVVSSRFDGAVGGITFANGSYHAVGGNGHYWRSDDNGQTWTILQNLTEGWQEDISAFGSSLYSPMTYGQSCTTADSGLIASSIDAGANWTPTVTVSRAMWGTSAVGAGEAWASGDDAAVYHISDTSNGTWYYEGCGIDPQGRLDDIFFTSPTNGWVVGDGVYHFDGTRFAPNVPRSSYFICPGETVQLLATGGTEYSWSPAVGLSDSSIANPVASPPVSTLYTVTVRDGLCLETFDVRVSVTSGSLGWGRSDVVANPRDRDIRIPIVSTVPLDGGICGIDSIELYLRLNATLFFPKSASVGTITENRVTAAGERLITVKLETASIIDGDSIVTELIGDALLGNESTTEVMLDSVRFNEQINPEPARVSDLRLSDICPVGGERFLSYRAGALKVLPHPVRTSGTIEATVDVEGIAVLTLLDETGALLMQRAWNSNGNREHPETRSLNVPTDLPSGVYTVRLQSGAERITVPLIVVR